jgi:UDP-N-acetylglucosamine pyrophosphorylase
VELAHKRTFNLEEAARATYAALLLTGGDGTRVPVAPPEYLAAIRRGEGSV